MKCPKCNNLMKKIKVKIQDAGNPIISHQCGKCNYFYFEKKSINKAIDEIKLKEMPLTLKQKKADLRDIFGSLKRKGSGQKFKDMVRAGWEPTH